MQFFWRKPFLVGLIGLAIWLPRGLALDRFVTVDEPSWLTFSGNFYQALTHGDLAHTFQIAHPGVTTTWAGTAAFLLRYPDYAREVPGQVDYTKGDAGRLIRMQGRNPVDVLAAGRAVVVLAITIVLATAFLYAVRLTGPGAALLGFVLIASDPFHLALSRVLHVDALASSFMLLSLLASLAYLREGRRHRDLIISGAVAGLAWLTKAPAFFLIPFVGALMLWELRPRWRNGRPSAVDLRWTVSPLLMWGAIGLLVFVLAWPAMWLNPISSLRAIAHEALGMAKFGHVEAPLFFNGAIVRGDPGWNFYPITYLWRTTPTVLLGLGFAALSLTISRWRSIEPSYRRTAAVLVLFSVLLTLLMTLGAKKFDRYLLPVYAPLDLVAAMGWLSAARWLKRGSKVVARIATPAVFGIAAAGQLSMALPAFPYYFSYYNPLLGGPPKAAQVMMIGWGEGLDQAARYLNGLPNAGQLRVATWVWNGTFSYFFNGHIFSRGFSPDTTGRRQWLSTDYCVIYINQRQRGRLPRALLEYVDSLQPVHVVRIHGLEYAQIYDLRDAPLPRYLLADTPEFPER